MTKQQTLDLMMLLSAIESWSFADKHCLPDYLHDNLSVCIAVLRKGLLG